MTDTKNPAPVPEPPAPARKPRPSGKGAFSPRNLLARGYALLILCVVVWTGYAAVAYLYRSVFKPSHIPARIGRWEAPVTVASLDAHQKSRTSSEPQPRAPFAHYHGVGTLFAAAPSVGCTTAGCHGPLPHAKRKEMRAFANLHTTFLDCMLCHDASINGPVKAGWVDIKTGQPSEAPAVLRLMKLFDTEQARVDESPAEMHPAIVAELKKIVVIGGHQPDLALLLTNLETSEPGSPVWRHSVEQLRDELPHHARGDYAAMIVAEASPEQRAAHEKLAEPAREFLRAAPDSQQRKALHERIHQGVINRPSACFSCHGQDPPRLDFAALGYPPARAADLRAAPIAHLMQQIQSGQPFYLPQMLEGPQAR